MGSFVVPWPFRKGKASNDKKLKQEEEEEESVANLEEYGVTQKLQDYIKGFTMSSFKDYPLQNDQDWKQIDGSASNVSNDLTEWQERHAMLVLSKVKEISQLRYVLCPRHLKERQFWRIYFLLVKSYVSPYEIRAFTKAKHRMLELQNEKSKDKIAIEVEMTDTKHASGSFITLQSDTKLPVDGEGDQEKGEGFKFERR